MTYQSKNVVEFSRFLTRLSESLEGGAPLSEAAELLAGQFDADAVAIQIGGRFSDDTAMTILYEREVSDEPADAVDLSPAARLAHLNETHTNLRASVASDCGHTRYELTILRTRSRGSFTDEDSDICEIFTAQLRRGIEISTRLGASEIEKTLYSGVLDRLFVGVVILDAKGHIVKASDAAKKVLDAKVGLREQSGVLRAISSREDRQFQTAIRNALLDPSACKPHGLSLSKPSGERNLGVIVQPITKGAGENTQAAVAVYIRDPDANAEVESGLVKQLFDLTPAETAVAHRLTTGLSLEEAACSLNISRNTARAHLRSIFSKSGISRQTELVRLMLNSAAVLGDPMQRTA